MSENEKKSQLRKPVTRRKFVVHFAVSAGLLGITVAANDKANHFRSLLDHFFGGRPKTIEHAHGTENWDSKYYDVKFNSRNQATEEASKLVTELLAEGAVLLKNENNVLPLAEGTEVSLLGRYAADPVYGGAGSGNIDESSCVTLYNGLKNQGLNLNDVAFKWISDNYKNYPKAQIAMDTPAESTYYIGEIPFKDYSSDAQNSISGTVAVIVVGRGGGEGGDLSRNLLGDLHSGVSSKFVQNNETDNYAEGQHQLELTVEEKTLISEAKKRASKVIVLVNASTTLELGPLVDGDFAVDAILHIGSLGATGADAVGQILTGKVNPSGRTTDIWSADFTADPVFGNFGGKQFTDVKNYYSKKSSNNVSDGTAYFVEYKEGVYMGYRYYETADTEAQAGNYDGFDYKKAVVFPFGYGLSYTTFTTKLDDLTTSGEKVQVTATVTNTGSVAGKEVVELYYSAPYEKGKLEKPAVVLGAFAKTDVINPGESAQVKLEFNIKSMASWDSDKGYYVLDAGEYVFSLRANSHDVLDQKSVTLSAQEYKTDEATQAEYKNHFDDLTQYMKKNCADQLLSRQNFKATFPKPAENRTAAECGLEFKEYNYKDHLDGNVTAPITGENNGLQLIDLRGKPMDDEAWEKLLNQVSVDEMIAMLNDGAYNTAAIPSIGKPQTSDKDGPAGFSSLTGSTGNCAYCSEVVMAQTWNTELMYRMGQMVGQEALASGYNGWYAPAMNTHRSPFAGRNFEYYSEDPTLGGKIASAVVSGAASNGCYAYIKHFAMNDQESYRLKHITTWATEQAVREIYLRQFEIPVKEATVDLKYIADESGTLQTKTIKATTGVMSCFNFVGAEWGGGRKSLLTDVLRGEWGFEGMVITDFNLYGHMNRDQSLAAGGDIQLTIAAVAPGFSGTDNPVVISRLREATHHVLYTVANSNAMQGVAPGSKINYGVAPWQLGLWGGSALFAGLGLFAGWRAYKINKQLKEQKALAAKQDSADGSEEAEKPAEADKASEEK